MTWFFALSWPLQAFWLGLAVVLLACFIGIAICVWEDLYMTPTQDETINTDQFSSERRANLRLIQGLDTIQKNATKGRM